MRVKIILFHDHEQGKRLARCAGQILTEISAAFGHVFTLIQEKIGDASVQAHGQRISIEAIEAASSCAASLLLSVSDADRLMLTDALNLPLELCSFCVPAALCRRYEAPVSLWTARALSADNETLEAAAAAIFHYASMREVPLTCVTPEEECDESYLNMLQKASAAWPNVRVNSIGSAEAVRAMILDPSECGVVYCPPYTGGIFHAAAEAVCAFPNLTYSAAPGNGTALYSTGFSLGKPNENPFSLSFAIAEMLRFALRLENEAACLEAAVNNVLLSGWRTEDLSQAEPVPPEKIIELICEQISVAGELMNKGAL